MDSTQSLIETLSKLNAEELYQLYCRVFDNDDGSLVLQDLRNRFYYHAPTINPFGSNDPMAVGVREGMRAAVMHIETSLRKPEVADGEREPD